MVTLRPYQEKALVATRAMLAQGRDPLISLPTGSGKSVVLAALLADAQREGKRALLVTHRKELLEQDAEALTEIDPTLSCGVYSAGLDRRDTDAPILFAGVQSIYQRMAELQRAGAFEIVIVDEAHLIPRSADSMYGAVFGALPFTARRVGLTATPYRLDSGLLHEGEDAMFDSLAIHVEPLSLVPEYLCPLIGVGTDQEMSVAGVHSRQGDYVTGELEQMAMDEDLIRNTVRETLRLAADRHHWLVFCITVAHAEAALLELTRQGVNAALITGKTPKDDRADLLRLFKASQLRALVNIGVLTTGYNAPLIDCLVMLRPTQSKGLWVQCLGRGMRKAENKNDCLVLDFAGNIARHGSINSFAEVRPSAKQQREEEEREKAAARVREIRHLQKAAFGDPMRGTEEGVTDVQDYRVARMRYSLQTSKKYPGKTNLVVDYCCHNAPTIRQWVCLEYPGGAAWHAKQWFRRRGVAMPESARSAAGMAYRMPTPVSISARQEKGFWRVLVEHWQEPTDAPTLTLFDD